MNINFTVKVLSISIIIIKFGNIGDEAYCDFPQITYNQK